MSDWEVMVAPNTVSSQGEVIGLNSTDSAYLIHSSPAMNDYNDKDLAPLSVALSYCSQIGGPMWSRVRGPGYTYFYALELIPDEGVIQFQLLRATNIVRAFNETLNIIVSNFDVKEYRVTEFWSHNYAIERTYPTGCCLGPKSF